MELPRRLYLDPSHSKIEHLYRRNNCIHYNLRKGDVMAAVAEIRRGTSPFIRDECNRTALDLAIVLFMRKFHESIYTSFVIDFIYKNRVKKTEVEFIYNNDGEIEPYNEKKFYHYDNIMNHMNDTLKMRKKSSIMKNGLTNNNNVECLLLQKKVTYLPLLVKCYDKLNKETSEHCKNSDLFILFEEVLTQPLSKKVQAQLNELLRKMNALLHFIKIVSSNIVLKKNAEIIMKEQIDNLSFPFFYNSTIHTLFKMYPLNHMKEKWDILNPADARRLVNMILSRKMIGNEIIRFMGKALLYFSNLIHVFSFRSFDQDSLSAQYLLHMSFTLDNVYLFQLILKQPKVFEAPDLFHWNQLITSIAPFKKTFSTYYKSLMYARLKKTYLERMEKQITQKEEKRSKKEQMKRESNRIQKLRQKEKEVDSEDSEDSEDSDYSNDEEEEEKDDDDEEDSDPEEESDNCVYINGKRNKNKDNKSIEQNIKNKKISNKKSTNKENNKKDINEEKLPKKQKEIIGDKKNVLSMDHNSSIFKVLETYKDIFDAKNRRDLEKFIKLEARKLKKKK